MPAAFPGRQGSRPDFPSSRVWSGTSSECREGPGERLHRDGAARPALAGQCPPEVAGLAEMMGQMAALVMQEESGGRPKSAENVRIRRRHDLFGKDRQDAPHDLEGAFDLGQQVGARQAAGRSGHAELECGQNHQRGCAGEATHPDQATQQRLRRDVEHAMEDTEADEGHRQQVRMARVDAGELRHQHACCEGRECLECVEMGVVGVADAEGLLFGDPTPWILVVVTSLP